VSPGALLLVAGALRFTDATAASGVAFTMTSGAAPPREILDVNGGGIALLDYDNDGDLDLFFANGATAADPEHGPGSRLYANDGKGRFTDATARAEIGVRRWAMGAAAADYDGDGWDDLYITCFGPDILLRNLAAPGGGRRFEDVTAKAGLGDPRWGTSAAWGDLDGDGDLDLYVANYLDLDPKHPPGRARFLGVSVMAGPAGLTPQPDSLYENRGDGTFADRSNSSGIHAVKPGFGLVAAIVDTDGDGRLDIFVGNDSTENFLFHNEGSFRFRNVGALSGICCNGDGGTQATMGVSLGDVDGNGAVDLFTTAFSSDTSTLHLNLGRAGRDSFEDRTAAWGLGLVSRPFLSWGSGLFDFDLDGDEDLLVSNGHVYPEAAEDRLDAPYLQATLLFERQGQRFKRTRTAGPVVEQPVAGRAVAFGDLDGDGDVDVVQTTRGGPVRVWRNDAASAAPGSLRPTVLTLRQAGANRRGLGARLEITTAFGVVRRWIGGGSFQSTDAPAACVALPAGQGGKAAATVRVIWPGGGESRHALEAGARGAVVLTRP